LPLNFEVDRNRVKFACFLPIEFFLEGLLKILDQDYKIEHTFEYHVKFHGDRPTELGDLARGKKVKINASKT